MAGIKIVEIGRRGGRRERRDPLNAPEDDGHVPIGVDGLLIGDVDLIVIVREPEAGSRGAAGRKARAEKSPSARAKRAAAPRATRPRR